MTNTRPTALPQPSRADIGKRVSGTHPLLVNGGELVDYELAEPEAGIHGDTCIVDVEVTVEDLVDRSLSPEGSGVIAVDTTDANHRVGLSLAICPDELWLEELDETSYVTVTRALEVAMWLERGPELLGEIDAREKFDELLDDPAYEPAIRYAIYQDWIEADDTPNEPGGSRIPHFAPSCANPFTK